MSKLHISSDSVEYIRLPVSATESGVPIDPTSNTVDFAFVQGGAEPSSWNAGSWETAGQEYLARILIGTGGVVLAAGTYNIWLRVTRSPEKPIRQVGVVVIY